jgi:hypothetical protein
LRKRPVGLDFSFAIENLDFSGTDNGCENIQLGLEFLDGDNPIHRVQLNRKYAALRDPIAESVKAGDQTFKWTGQYVKPKKEDTSEVFALSTPDLKEAMELKRRLDQAGQVFSGMPVVAVLRPPLNSDKFGVVIGVRQPSGQVKFTFDRTTAAQIKQWAQNLHKTTPKLLHREPFTYTMRPGDSGTGKSCGTPQT